MEANEHYSKILVVEDEQALRFLMRKQLEQLGFEVDVAENGLEAIRYFEDSRYLLIFMDIQMPYMDGLMATAAIRSHEHQLYRTPTPIIATTSGGASRELCLTVGMSDYLAKPVKIEQLKAVLEQYSCNKGRIEVAS